MCDHEQNMRMELVDEQRIISNLWAVTLATKKLPELFHRLQGLFTLEERTNMIKLQDDHLKCFLLYGKFIKEHKNLDNQTLLLKALRATDNNFVVDQIKQIDTQTKTTQQQNTDSGRICTLPELITRAKGNDSPSTKVPPSVHYQVDGKDRVYPCPKSLRISQGLQHLLTTLKLMSIQVNRRHLKEVLKPCLSLQELDLVNVTLTTTAITRTVDDTDEDVEPKVIFPKLKSYTYHNTFGSCCDSTNYNWGTIFFFSILENVPCTLLNIWNSQIKIDVCSQSMSITLNPESSTVAILLPKKEYYDSPNFVTYISKQDIRDFFSKNSSQLETFNCLLPSNFDTLDFNELPDNVSHFCVSGLNISYSANKDVSTAKFYKICTFEKCTIPQSLLDEILTAMPLTRRVQFKECHIESCESADININMTF